MHSYFLFIEATGCFGHFIWYQSRYSAGLVKIVLSMSLEMSKTNIMRPSPDAIATIMKREQMSATGAYDTVK